MVSKINNKKTYEKFSEKFKRIIIFDQYNRTISTILSQYKNKNLINSSKRYFYVFHFKPRR